MSAREEVLNLRDVLAGLVLDREELLRMAGHYNNATYARALMRHERNIGALLTPYLVQLLAIVSGSDLVVRSGSLNTIAGEKTP